MLKGIVPRNSNQNEIKETADAIKQDLLSRSNTTTELKTYLENYKYKRVTGELNDDTIQEIFNYIKKHFPTEPNNKIGGSRKTRKNKKSKKMKNKKKRTPKKK